MIDCPELLQNINFNANQIYNRNTNVFCVNNTKTNNTLNSTPNVLMSAGNLASNLDYFNKS